METGLEFETTPENEAVRALERLRDELLRAERDPYDWKWAIIAGHNAIQNFMVAALDSTSREAVFSDAYNVAFRKWWHERGGEGTPPSTYLAVFMELYRRLETPFSIFNDMDAVNHWRNDFIHFVLNTWSVSVRVLPGRFLQCLRVVEYAGWNPGRFQWDDDDLRVRGERAYAECVEILTRLRAAYQPEIGQACETAS